MTVFHCMSASSGHEEMKIGYLKFQSFEEKQS